MPIALQLGLSGTVASSGDAWPTFTGELDNPAETPATLLGTVSDAAATSYTAPVTWHYFRIRLAGEWIPETDLVGNLEIPGKIDSPIRTFSFGLRGERYSVLLTETTWTRTPVEVWTYRGSSPSAMLGEPEISGFVLTCSQDDEHGPVLKVRCADNAGLYERFELCHEVEPFAGKTRGQHIRDLVASAGITDVDVPEGSPYNKPLQVVNRRLWDYVTGFGEPEGWFFRWRGATLEVRSIELVEEPQPPDDVWAPDDWEALRVRPPDRVPSRWILRGTAPVVYVDEAGLETEITETVVEAPYRVRQAVARQNLDGSITDLTGGLIPTEEIDQVVSRVTDERVTQGGKVVRHDLREHSWYNPRIAKLLTATGGTYAFNFARIDEDGNHVLFPRERFLLTAWSTTTPAYDEDGNLVSSEEVRRAYTKKSTAGISQHGNANPESPTVLGVSIHDDDQSYIQERETFDVDERILTTYEHDPATGAERKEIRDRYAWYVPRCRVSGSAHGGWYNLYDGTAQTEIWDNTMRRVEQVTTTKQLSADAALLGEVLVKLGYKGPDTSWFGEYDWGGTMSYQEEERFRFVSRETKAYRILSEDQYEIVKRGADGEYEVETVAGKLPLPRFLLSAWTRYRQQPIEVVLDDETVEAWFGFQRNAFSSDFVQSVEEAEALLERRFRRALARRVEVVRPRALAREGDTIHLVDPRHGLDHRGLIVGESSSWDLRTGSATSTYELEVYL